MGWRDEENNVSRAALPAHSKTVFYAYARSSLRRRKARDIGLPLIEAAGGDCMCLRGAEEAVPIATGAHAQIRINVSPILTFTVWTI
jgi:hypothetical protein